MKRISHKRILDIIIEPKTTNIKRKKITQNPKDNDIT